MNKKNKKIVIEFHNDEDDLDYSFLTRFVLTFSICMCMCVLYELKTL
jgi:hypothetical protein